MRIQSANGSSATNMKQYPRKDFTETEELIPIIGKIPKSLGPDPNLQTVYIYLLGRYFHLNYLDLNENCVGVFTTKC